MKNVVLLALNAKYAHSSLSVWALAAAVKPHAVRVIEATIHNGPHDIVERVAQHNPDVVGFSTYIWNAPMLPELLTLLRTRLPGAVFVMGGPEAAHNEEHWLAHGADAVLKGGEREFAAFLGCREIEAPQAENWPDPYTSEHLASLKGRIAYLETSRGCPFCCAFCLSAGTNVSFLPLDKAKARMVKLACSGARTIKLVDRTFNCDSARAYELFEFVIGLETACVFHFEVAPDLFDDSTLRLLAASPPGRIQLEAGLQSFHQPALNAVSRKTDLLRAEKNIKALISAGNIHVHVDLIAGLPGETLSHFQDSFDRAYSLGAHNLQLGFLKLLHGSILRDRAEALGIKYSAEPPYEISESSWLGKEDLSILKSAENALRHTSNKSRFLSSIEYVLRASGLRPFELFRLLGEAAPNHGTPLDVYAEQFYAALSGLSGVAGDKLLDCLAYDWARMVRGAKNVPRFIRGRELEAAAGAQKKDPVTSLYHLGTAD